MVVDHRGRFEQAYDAYSGLIFAYAAQRVADRQDAADVVAETFAVAWRRIEDVPAGAEARPWLYGVARNVLANHHRGARRRHRLDRRLAAEVGGMIGASSMPDREALAEAFNSLTARDREILELVGWDGLSMSEVADVLGCTQPTPRVRLHRARKRFGRALHDAGVQRTTHDGHGSGRWATAHPDPEEA